MSDRHTPGPWSIDASVRTAINAGDKHVALANFYNSTNPAQNVSGKEHEANARLIASAPEMLALLEWLDRKGGLGLDVHERITAVLAKVNPA